MADPYNRINQIAKWGVTLVTSLITLPGVIFTVFALISRRQVMGVSDIAVVAIVGWSTAILLSLFLIIYRSFAEKHSENISSALKEMADSERSLEQKMDDLDAQLAHFTQSVVTVLNSTTQTQHRHLEMFHELRVLPRFRGRLRTG